MANSSPAILPISDSADPIITVSSDTAAITTTDAHQSSSVSSFGAFYSKISDTVRVGLANRRPWPELLDRTSFSKPESLSEAILRFRKNYNYYRINYLTVITAVLAISLLTNPFSLILLSALLAAWLFLYIFRQSSDPPVTIFGRQFSDFETLLFLIFSTVVIIFLTSVGSVLVSAFMIGVAIVFLHGSFRTPEDLFLDDQESQGGVSGFLSLFTGGTASNAAAVSVGPPPVAAGI
ncbi:PRA1 family protein B4-like [Olea europaea var. sylvestris]|uniref:PRA1 family protein n=1 Tax=Olea europaea subsp. europaea TaxID=158383 RepID=A0A8S0RK66_OLEEU|nr:PRA1 family protein B4-like [Olea europaea var. sylvestris]CAA2979464.1 PRA1 family B4-like [Olea europaea subsp. europaea]